MSKKARAIAFYLPQYHPVPENDAFWGKGFTEWTNVTKAKPLFKGHKQPKLPADLGFYDLRVAEVRAQQAQLAKDAGIEAFCYWHYWFGNGVRVLEKIFDEVLTSKQPDFPFCLGWANESWTGKWHGMNDEFLFKQIYPGQKDFKAHFNTVLPAFKDKRYFTVNGQPLFLIYNPRQIPEPVSFTNYWQQLAKEAGLPGIYFVGVDNKWEPEEYGFSASVTNAPWAGKIFPARKFKNSHRILAALGTERPFIYDYEKYVSLRTSQPLHLKECPLVVPNWDNTPRSGNKGRILWGSTPEKYGKWLNDAVQKVQHRPKEERIVFIKSWNEWAEGNYLEPCREFGHEFLNQTKKALIS